MYCHFLGQSQSLLFLLDGWLDFLHIWYHDRVPCAADAHKIEFVFIPHLSNYGHFVIKLVSFVISQRRIYVNFVHIWYSNQVPCVADTCKIAFGSVSNVSNYIYFLFVVISR